MQNWNYFKENKKILTNFKINSKSEMKEVQQEASEKLYLPLFKSVILQFNNLNWWLWKTSMMSGIKWENSVFFNIPSDNKTRQHPLKKKILPFPM